jgi:UDP-MurNAc hydroxylase
MPNFKKIIQDFELSKLKMQERLRKINLIPDVDVFINIKDKDIKVLSEKNSKGLMQCSLDLRLLREILDKKSHWNNAQIGCHIEFNRSPNIHSVDIHTALSFLHL